MCTHVYIYTNTTVGTCIFVHIDRSIYVHTCSFLSLSFYFVTFLASDIHIYVHIYIHTYIHMHKREVVSVRLLAANGKPKRQMVAQLVNDESTGTVGVAHYSSYEHFVIKRNDETSVMSLFIQTGEDYTFFHMHREGVPDEEEMVLAAAAVKLLPTFWKRFVTETGYPANLWVLPLCFGPLKTVSTLEIGTFPTLLHPKISAQQVELCFPAVPSDSRENWPATMIQVPLT